MALRYPLVLSDTGTLQELQAADGLQSIVDTNSLVDASVTTAKLANASVTVSKINATGTPSSSTALKGDGTWGKVGGATGGGTDGVFYENDQTVTTNYTITTGKNAVSAGPITINTGVTVTVPDNSTWVIA